MILMDRWMWTNSFPPRPAKRDEPGEPDSQQTAPEVTYVIGQEDLVGRLRKFCEFFTSRGSTPGHILLIGEEGMGQRLIARAFANELGVAFQEMDASDLEIKGDLTAALTNLRNSQVLLLENVQLLKRPPVLDLLTGALRDPKVDITIGVGQRARVHTIQFPAFTLIATCLRRAECPSELLSAFSLILSLQPYSRSELQVIAGNIAKRDGVFLEPRAAELIARHCDGRPRDLELILRRLVRAINKAAISEDDTLQAFSIFGFSVQRSSPLTNEAGSLNDLSGEDFEKLIAELLGRMGFRAETTKPTGDGGIDIVATSDKAIFGGRYLFQCKRFAPDTPVGAPAVRDFYGAVTAERAVKGIFVTTSDFTVQAREFGEKVGLELVNWRRLRELFVEYGIAEKPPDVGGAAPGGKRFFK
jgi:Holliday junction resolvasome RuvABC ATP-dependent DNA helicase subunit